MAIPTPLYTGREKKGLVADFSGLLDIEQKGYQNLYSKRIAEQQKAEQARLAEEESSAKYKDKFLSRLKTDPIGSLSKSFQKEQSDALNQFYDKWSQKMLDPNFDYNSSLVEMERDKTDLMQLQQRQKQVEGFITTQLPKLTSQGSMYDPQRMYEAAGRVIDGEIGFEELLNDPNLIKDFDINSNVLNWVKGQGQIQRTQAVTEAGGTTTTVESETELYSPDVYARGLMAQFNKNPQLVMTNLQREFSALPEAERIKLLDTDNSKDVSQEELSAMNTAGMSNPIISWKANQLYELNKERLKKGTTKRKPTTERGGLSFIFGGGKTPATIATTEVTEKPLRTRVGSEVDGEKSKSVPLQTFKRTSFPYSSKIEVSENEVFNLTRGKSKPESTRGMDLTSVEIVWMPTDSKGELVTGDDVTGATEATPYILGYEDKNVYVAKYDDTWANRLQSKYRAPKEYTDQIKSIKIEGYDGNEMFNVQGTKYSMSQLLEYYKKKYPNAPEDHLIGIIRNQFGKK